MSRLSRLGQFKFYFNIAIALTLVFVFAIFYQAKIKTIGKIVQNHDLKLDKKISSSACGKFPDEEIFAKVAEHWQVFRS